MHPLYSLERKAFDYNKSYLCLPWRFCVLFLLEDSMNPTQHMFKRSLRIWYEFLINSKSNFHTSFCPINSDLFHFNFDLVIMKTRTCADISWILFYIHSTIHRQVHIVDCWVYINKHTHFLCWIINYLQARVDSTSKFVCIWRCV